MANATTDTAFNTTGAGSASFSSSGNASTVGLRSLLPDETCGYLAPEPFSGCQRPRSCASCLGISGCMIGLEARCVSTEEAHYDPNLDYSRAIERGQTLNSGLNSTDPGPQFWLFLAGSARYCPSSDAVCQRCIANRFYQTPERAYHDNRFCVGADGCVCIDKCENYWSPPYDCATPAPFLLPQFSLPAATERVLLGTLVLVVAIVLSVLLVRRRRKRRREAARAERRQQRREVRERRRHEVSEQLGIEQLTLSGWKIYVTSLIDKERAMLREGGETIADEASTSERGSSDGIDDAIGAPHGDTVAVYTSMNGEEQPPSSAVQPRDAEPTSQPLAPLLGTS